MRRCLLVSMLTLLTSPCRGLLGAMVFPFSVHFVGDFTVYSVPQPQS